MKAIHFKFRGDNWKGSITHAIGEGDKKQEDERRRISDEDAVGANGNKEGKVRGDALKVFISNKEMEEDLIGSRWRSQVQVNLI